MPARAAHIDHPDDAREGDAGLRAARDLTAMAMAALAHGGPDARRAAARALEWLHGDEANDLASALGLAGPGRTHARQRLRQERRDEALRALRRARCPDLNPTAAGAFLAQAWRRYAATAWPRNRDADIVPTAEPEATLHELLARGHDPLSARRLRAILGDGVG